MWSTFLPKNKLPFIKNEKKSHKKIHVTNKGIERQTEVVQNLNLKGIIKVGTNNILKPKSNNQYPSTHLLTFLQQIKRYLCISSIYFSFLTSLQEEENYISK